MADDRWPDLAGRIAGDAHILPVRVYYEDTDFSGIVYHANYLKFCERGRTDMLRLSGSRHADLASGADGEAVVFAVRRMAIDFLRPARIDETLEVETRIGEIGGASITLDQRVVRGGEVLFTARVKAAVLNAQGRPRRLPEAVRAALARFASRAGTA